MVTGLTMLVNARGSDWDGLGARGRSAIFFQRGCRGKSLP